MRSDRVCLINIFSLLLDHWLSWTPEMKLVFGLMLLLKTAASVERFCWFNQAAPCNAVLGDKLSLMMMPDAREHNLKIHKINYNTEDDPVCKIKTDRIKKYDCDLFNNRHDEVSVNNGILIINSVIRADSGNYSLQIYNSVGTETSADLQVIIEESPSSGSPESVMCSESPSSVVHVLVWCFQVMVLLGLLGGFHIYMRLTSGKEEEDQSVRMRRFREGHEDTAED
ncbi:hypothetical protein R3I93_015111 [Phoxinus phoxinus]|uniref:Immunoglobulin subtype domain-containing protein n=1 Tax=Phoxinus phoxinus TaxID=58324 RepID=A0AAN9CQW6_9TELE